MDKKEISSSTEPTEPTEVTEPIDIKKTKEGSLDRKIAVLLEKAEGIKEDIEKSKKEIEKFFKDNDTSLDIKRKETIIEIMEKLIDSGDKIENFLSKKENWNEPSVKEFIATTEKDFKIEIEKWNIFLVDFQGALNIEVGKEDKGGGADEAKSEEKIEAIDSTRVRLSPIAEKELETEGTKEDAIEAFDSKKEKESLRTDISKLEVKIQSSSSTEDPKKIKELKQELREKQIRLLRLEAFDSLKQKYEEADKLKDNTEKQKAKEKAFFEMQKKLFEDTKALETDNFFARKYDQFENWYHKEDKNRLNKGLKALLDSFVVTVSVVGIGAELGTLQNTQMPWKLLNPILAGISSTSGVGEKLAKWFKEGSAGAKAGKVAGLVGAVVLLGLFATPGSLVAMGVGAGGSLVSSLYFGKKIKNIDTQVNSSQDINGFEEFSQNAGQNFELLKKKRNLERWKEGVSRASGIFGGSLALGISSGKLNDLLGMEDGQQNQAVFKRAADFLKSKIGGIFGGGKKVDVETPEESPTGQGSSSANEDLSGGDEEILLEKADRGEGVTQTLKDLYEKNPNKIPDWFKKAVPDSGSKEAWAKFAEEIGVYKPGDLKDSLVINEGDSLGFDEKGDLVLERDGVKTTIAYGETADHSVPFNKANWEEQMSDEKFMDTDRYPRVSESATSAEPADVASPEASVEGSLEEITTPKASTLLNSEAFDSFTANLNEGQKEMVREILSFAYYGGEYGIKINEVDIKDMEIDDIQKYLYDPQKGPAILITEMMRPEANLLNMSKISTKDFMALGKMGYFKENQVMQDLFEEAKDIKFKALINTSENPLKLRQEIEKLKIPESIETSVSEEREQEVISEEDSALQEEDKYVKYEDIGVGETKYLESEFKSFSKIFGKDTVNKDIIDTAKAYQQSLREIFFEGNNEAKRSPIESKIWEKIKDMKAEDWVKENPLSKKSRFDSKIVNDFYKWFGSVKNVTNEQVVGRESVEDYLKRAFVSEQRTKGNLSTLIFKDEEVPGAEALDGMREGTVGGR